MIKCCIFDLDGTILDTITTITHFVNKALQKFGYGSITVDQCKYFAGNGARTLITRSLAYFGVSDKEEIERVLASYDADYKSDPYNLTEVFSGIPEALSALRSEGIKLAVISNKQDKITKDAIAYFFPGMFDLVYGGRDGVALKPAPDAPLALLRELGCRPEETAFIGDTSVDVETGKNMGAGRVIGVLWGFRKADELCAADVIISQTGELFDAVIK